MFSLCLALLSLPSYAAILPATSFGDRSVSATPFFGHPFPFIPGSAAAAPANVTAHSNNTGFVDSQYAAGLSNGTSMAFAPDGRLFVTLQNGDLRVVKNGTLLDRPFLHLNVNSLDERGLLGVAVDPQFEENGYVYVYYTTSAAPIHNRVSRFTADSSNPDIASAGSEKILLELENLGTLNLNGGALHFGSDGKLYVGTGDNNQQQSAQSLSSRLGKILRINPDGTAPPDNPFFNATGARKEIWALGLRNPFTFAIRDSNNNSTSQTGVTMYINDVGKDSMEEIDQGIKGGNYGWPACEGPCPASSNSNFTEPVFSYGHPRGQSRAITGGVFYQASQFPSEYRGSYFFGDFLAHFIKRLTPDNRVVDFLANATSPVDIDVGPDGSLYYLSHVEGTVHKVSYPTPSSAEPPRSAKTTGSTAPNQNATTTTPVAGLPPKPVRSLEPTILEPVMKDAKDGKKMSASTINKAVVLSTTIDNNNNQNETRLATVMEARRVSDGITYYFSWHQDSLKPQDNATTVQFSWIPETPGDYQLRTFAISDLEKPHVLTQVATSNIAISKEE